MKKIKAVLKPIIFTADNIHCQTTATNVPFPESEVIKAVSNFTMKSLINIDAVTQCAITLYDGGGEDDLVPAGIIFEENKYLSWGAGNAQTRIFLQYFVRTQAFSQLLISVATEV